MVRIDPDQLEVLLAAALAELDAGGEVALQRFLDAHPQERRALERGLARVRQLGFAEAGARAPDLPERLGEFRILRRLGSGGMGVVYEAEQESLGRRVALKVVRPELLYFEGARESFRREIEAVARLQHPAIVPVLASGEQDGVPYYAMELLQGVSLQELTQELRRRGPGAMRGKSLREAAGLDAESGTDPLDGPWWQAATKIILAVALGVRHAHLRGIVHRDIKPSNVMLTREGRAVLLDFGVARVADRGEFTRTGHAPGSPAFMSPEQLQGHAVDERTDVYSLAATLWQLLTLSPPFTHGAGLDRILRGDLPQLRSLLRELPRELAIVIHKAMDVDRERRYADMQAFADDLAAVLQRRPIAARRLPPTLRVLRWAQRHRIAATALVCVVAAAAVLPAIAAVREAALNRELALAARRADQSLDTTLDAIASLLVRVGEDRLRYVPAGRQLAIEVLTEACGMYRKLLPEHPGHQRIRVDTGKALSRLADLLERDGNTDGSLAALQEGLEVLGAGNPAVPAEYRHARIYLTINLARQLFRQRRDAAAEQALQAAESDLASLAGDPRFASNWRRHQLHVLMARADHAGSEDHGVEARYAAAVAAARALAGEPHCRPEDAVSLIEVLDNYATWLHQHKRFDEALPLVEEALRTARAMPEDAPVWPPATLQIAKVLATLGNLHASRRDLAAVAPLQECLALRERVARDHPSDLFLRSDVAAALHNLARLSYYQAQDQVVVERLTRALELQRQVVAEMPHFRQGQEYLMQHLSLLGSALAKLDRLEDLERTAAELSTLPQDPVAKRRAARLWLRCVAMLDAAQAKAGDPGERRNHCLQHALDNLLAAEQLGWGSGSAFTEKVYDPLRESPVFQALQQRIAARQQNSQPGTQTATQTSVSPPSTSNAKREIPR